MSVTRKFYEKTSSETYKTCDIGAEAKNVSYNDSYFKKDNVQDTLDSLISAHRGIVDFGSLPVQVAISATSADSATNATNANYATAAGSSQTAQSASSADKLKTDITVVLGGDNGTVPDPEVYSFSKTLNAGQTIMWNSQELSQSHSHYNIAVIGGWGLNGGSDDDQWIYNDPDFGVITFANDHFNVVDGKGTIDNAWKKTFGKMLIRLDLQIDNIGVESIYAWAPLDLIFDNAIKEPSLALRMSYFNSPSCYLSTRVFIEKHAPANDPSNSDYVTVTIYYNSQYCPKTDNVEIIDAYLYMVQ